jgi:hypothetical protein
MYKNISIKNKNDSNNIKSNKIISLSSLSSSLKVNNKNKNNTKYENQISKESNNNNEMLTTGMKLGKL